MIDLDNTQNKVGRLKELVNQAYYFRVLFFLRKTKEDITFNPNICYVPEGRSKYIYPTSSISQKEVDGVLVSLNIRDVAA